MATSPSPADQSPTTKLPRQEPSPPEPIDDATTPVATGEPKPPRNRQTVLLVAVIVVALVVGGLASAELYARNRAADVLRGVTECLVRDSASASFAVNPPFLWQYLTDRYTDITVETAGERVQSADGMTAEVTLQDVRLADTADSKGTIGSLAATLSWTSEGIKETLVDELPEVGSLVTGISTDPGAGTIVLEAGDNRVTAKPVVNDGDLTLEVLDVDGAVSKEFVQTALNDLTTRLNDNYPLGIQADSVDVTESGVVGTFSSRDASIPQGDADPCFAAL